jgi:hypothetical protein
MPEKHNSLASQISRRDCDGGRALEDFYQIAITIQS